MGKPSEVGIVSSQKGRLWLDLLSPWHLPYFGRQNTYATLASDVFKTFLELVLKIFLSTERRKTRCNMRRYDLLGTKLAHLVGKS